MLMPRLLPLTIKWLKFPHISSPDSPAISDPQIGCK